MKDSPSVVQKGVIVTSDFTQFVDHSVYIALTALPAAFVFFLIVVGVIVWIETR